jgi:hypothetical protein
MKGVIVWSILVTAVIATDGENDINVAEKKGPGCKYTFLYNEINTFLLILSLSPMQFTFKNKLNLSDQRVPPKHKQNTIGTTIRDLPTE